MDIEKAALEFKVKEQAAEIERLKDEHDKVLAISGIVKELYFKEFAKNRIREQQIVDLKADVAKLKATLAKVEEYVDGIVGGQEADIIVDELNNVLKGTE